jgi:RimJ/RimL family protein N-acetyltransferase
LNSELVTERLTLRPLASGDAGWIARDIARPDVQKMLPTVPHPYSIADARAWLAGRRREGNFAVVRNGEPVGVVTLALANGAPELGYWLAPSAWGQGFMTEAAGAALAAHFARSARPIPSGHIIDNLASRRVLQKLGFADLGLIFRMSYYRGHTVVVRRMALSRATWEARNGH